MKINKIFLTATIALFLAGSCSDSRLELIPEDQFQMDSAILTEKDMGMVVNGIYTNFSKADGFGANVLFFGDLISDNVFISKDAGDVAYKTTGELNWNADLSDFGGLMDNLYDAILSANLVINNTTLPDSSEVQNYKGEAKIARGLAYFYAVSYYSPDPKSGVNQEYGVPLNLGVYDPVAQFPRATVAEVYEQIIKDLTEGIEMMGNTGTTVKGHLTPVAAKLLLSRVYLTRGQTGDYQKSLDYAQQIIDIANANPDVIANKNIPGFYIKKDDYVNYLSGKYRELTDGKSETLWEINMSELPGTNPGINAAMAAFYANDGAKKRFLFPDDFVKSIKTTDYRRQFFTQAGASVLDAPRGWFIKKYVVKIKSGPVPPLGEADTAMDEPYAQNIKILRTSEAKLNKIEALYKLGRSAEALNELNDFATLRAGNKYTAATIENILNERRLEFAGEGQRFFDLKRNGLGFNRKTNCYSVICNVDATNRIFVLPMSLREMNANPKMKQYPGY